MSLIKPGLVFPRQGPRDWTPRVMKAARQLEILKSLIPAELQKHIEEVSFSWDSLTGQEAILVLMVQARKWNLPWAPKQWQWLIDKAWISEQGRIITECGIKDLLSGTIEGYEHLAGRWEKWMDAIGEPYIGGWGAR